MANTFNFGNGNWAQKTEKVLAYNAENNNYKPLPFDFDRGSTATRVNKQGLIETVGIDEPRIDFLNNSKGHLLLEPERRNSLLQSNQFDTTWTLSASIDLTGGQNGVGGSNNAWLLKRNSTGSRYIQQSLSLSSAQYSYSVYLKAESANWAFIWSYDGSASVNAYFDLENGVVGQIGGADLDSTNIESVGNGWYRCTLIYTHAPDLVRIYPAYSNGSISTGIDNGIYIQYAQLEAGSYATSYIPTQGSAVTRSEESSLQGGFQDKNIFGSTQGTVVLEFKWDINNYVFDLNDASTIRLRLYNDNNTTWRIRDYISASWYFTGFSITQGQKVKIGIKWNGTEVIAFQNGVKSVNTGTFSSNMAIKSITSNKLNNTSNMQFYNTALTDAELIQLTS